MSRLKIKPTERYGVLWGLAGSDRIEIGDTYNGEGVMCRATSKKHASHIIKALNILDAIEEINDGEEEAT